MDGMVAMLPDSIQAMSTEIDFVGQKTAERTYQVILTLSGIIGFFIGFYFQQLSYAIYTVMGASAFCAILVLPPWPFLYKKNPVEWRTKEGQQEEESASSEKDKKMEKKKKETKKTK